MTEFSTALTTSQINTSNQRSITIPTGGEKLSRLVGFHKDTELSPATKQDIESLRAPQNGDDVPLGCCVGLSCGVVCGFLLAGGALAVAAGIGAIVGAIDSDTTPGDTAIEAVKWASIPASILLCCTTACCSGAGGVGGRFF